MIASAMPDSIRSVPSAAWDDAVALACRTVGEGSWIPFTACGPTVTAPLGCAADALARGSPARHAARATG